MYFQAIRPAPRHKTKNYKFFRKTHLVRVTKLAYFEPKKKKIYMIYSRILAGNY